MPSLGVIQPARFGQKAGLSGKELIVTTYCTQLAKKHWVMKWSGCWEISLKMYNKVSCWYFRWIAFNCIPWQIFGVCQWTRFSQTYDNIGQHILHRIFAVLHSAFLQNIDLDFLEFGWRLTEDSNLVLIISSKPSISTNIHQPCNCQKCSKASV